MFELRINYPIKKHRYDVNVTTTCFQYIHGTTCPALDEELDKLHDSENYTTFVTKNQDFINEICSEAGYSPSEWTVKSLGRVYSNLFCDVNSHFHLSSSRFLQDSL